MRARPSVIHMLRLGGRRFRIPEHRRRSLDFEAARFRRSDALDAFDLAAARLEAVRRSQSLEPVEIVAAEARLETARLQFWAADRDYRVALDRLHEVG